jgi:hypothetical protein
MAVNDLQKQEMKNKAAVYLEKSIYTLSYLLSVDPESALEVSNVGELIALSSITGTLSTSTTASFNSLFNQIASLKLLEQ